MTNMKITLAEKPKLIPSTPPLPATLEGSLQPSQAITAGAFAKTAPITEARKSLIAPTCANSSGRAIDKPKIRLRSFVGQVPTGMVVRRAIGCRHRRRSSEQPPARWRRTRRGLRLDGRSTRRGSLALIPLDIRRSLNSRLEGG
jgi:hypothetical protein